MSSSGISLNSNIASQRTQRRLGQNTGALQRSFERLSSGLRIVRASDDAAGLAIASSLSVDTRVYTQGTRNLNDGVSYLNIADAAIEQLKSIVIRCRELATQAANGTISNTQRKVLHLEAQALSSEYNRILSTSEFNGRKVFDGTETEVYVQSGYGADEVLSARTGEGVVTTKTTRVSTKTSGEEATTNYSSSPSISADGRFISFISSASDLVAGDSNGNADVFVKDLQTGTITMVTTNSSGVQGNGYAIFHSISGDGRYVAYSSNSSNLVAGDTNGKEDVFVKDMQTGITTRISTDSNGNQGIGGGGSSNPKISVDGRYVVFESTSTNLVPGDTNATFDVFVKDLQTGITTRVSTDSNGNQSNGMSFTASISADGRYVTFESYASNLVSGDTNGKADIFVKDLQTGSTTRVSTNSSGTQATDDSSYSTISADGRYVAFQSRATNLVSNDTNGSEDIFVKDLQTGVTTRVSTSSSGIQADSMWAMSPSISADGRYVAFCSGATNLVDDDTNGEFDVFVKDLQTGATTRINKSPNGSQTNDTSESSTISADGQWVALSSSATNLITGDTNGQGDVFLVQNTAISSAPGFESSVRPLVGIFLEDKTLARMAQGTLDNYLKELNTAAGFIGSSMSRFSVAISTQGVRIENFAAAASRIVDIDVAEESSELLRRNILQQAATSVLAEANIQSAIALNLLR